MDPLGVRARIPFPADAARLTALAVFALAACSSSSSGRRPPPDRPTGPSSDAGPEFVAPRASRRSSGEFAQLESAIRRFASDRAGRLPASLEELTTERSPDGDRYLSSIPMDVWGRPYSYAVVSARLGSYDLRSYGPDTLPDTADDVVADAKPVPVR